jgi:hypothetical protein
MESQICKIYAPSNAAGRQLPITEFAHKTTIVSDGRMPAVAATLDMAAERRRAACLHRAHDLALATAQMPGIAAPIRRTMAAEYIRHLEPRP